MAADQIETRLAVVSKGLESAAADLQALVEQMEAVLGSGNNNNSKTTEVKAEEGEKKESEGDSDRT